MKKTDVAASLLLILPYLFNTLDASYLNRILDLMLNTDAPFLSALTDTFKTDEEISEKLTEFMGNPKEDDRVTALRIAVLFLRGVQHQWGDVCREWDENQDLSEFLGDHLQALLATEGIQFMDLHDLSPAHRLGYVAAVGAITEIMARKDFLEDFFKGTDVASN